MFFLGMLSFRVLTFLTADRSKIGGDQDLIKPDILEVHLLLLVTNT